MSKDRIWLLISKKMAGEANAEELTELEELLRGDPDMHYALQNLSDLWNLPVQPTNDADDVFDRHTSRMKDAGINWQKNQEAPDYQSEEPFLQRRNSNIRWITGIAASLLLIAGIIWFYPRNKPTNNPVAGQANQSSQTSQTSQSTEKNEIITRNGSKTRITLPDGSHVWLNAGSKLTYNKEFGNGTREVELSGEAFFDVVHLSTPQNGKKIPFIIHTRQIDIRVLGTQFNVKSYPGESLTETSLVRGKVEIHIHDRPDEKIILKPNEKLVVRNDEPTIHDDTAENKPLVSLSKLTWSGADSNIIAETAWVENKLVFDNEALSDIVTKMERWYNVRFRFKDSSVKKQRFSGVFEKETVQQAMDYLSISGPFHYRMQGDIVYIDQ